MILSESQRDWPASWAADTRTSSIYSSEKQPHVRGCLQGFSMADPHKKYAQEIYITPLALCWCMCLLQILGVYLFKRLRKLTIIKKRYPRLVMMEALVSCCLLALIWPMYMILRLDYFQIRWEWWPYALHVIQIYTAQIPATIETCRIWLISYDLQYLHLSKNQQWKTVINASYADRDWYLQNRGKWGNERFIIRLGVTYHILTNTAVLLAYILEWCFNIGYVYSYAGRAIFSIIHVVLPLYLFAKTPRKLQDQFLFFIEVCTIMKISATLSTSRRNQYSPREFLGMHLSSSLYSSSGPLS